MDAEVKKLLSSAAKPNDPIFQNYQSSMAETSGRSLDLTDLKVIANELVIAAHMYHPGEVGDDHQTAVLSNGKVSSFDEPITPPEPTNLQLAGIVSGAESVENMVAFVLGPPAPGSTATPTLFIRARIEGIASPCTSQQLDNTIFTHSVFRKTCFVYAGSPLTIFDSSNVLTGCTLHLSSGVDEDSPFVSRFRREFPNVTITGPLRQPQSNHQ